mmetsp:Transcript_88495/g.277108  ORF Transcript_88495/g.277108 Transcript_88495/m.277108 type:complete len:220 (+) Transcript_88495:125-784(+)
MDGLEALAKKLVSEPSGALAAGSLLLLLEEGDAGGTASAVHGLGTRASPAVEEVCGDAAGLLCAAALLCQLSPQEVFPLLADCQHSAQPALLAALGEELVACVLDPTRGCGKGSLELLYHLRLCLKALHEPRPASLQFSGLGLACCTPDLALGSKRALRLDLPSQGAQAGLQLGGLCAPLRLGGRGLAAGRGQRQLELAQGARGLRPGDLLHAQRLGPF